MHELRCPSIADVYDMTWAEFRLRSFAYNREQESEWFKLHWLGYEITKAPHLDYKRIPKTLNGYLPEGMRQERKGVSDEHKAILLAKTEEYLKKINGTG